MLIEKLQLRVLKFFKNVGSFCLRLTIIGCCVSATSALFDEVVGVEVSIK